MSEHIQASVDEKIKQIKEQSKFCAFCKLKGKEVASLFDGVGIPIVSVTESGQIIPQDAQSMFPLCWYHFCLAQEGLFWFTTQNALLQSKILTALENKSDRELNAIIRQNKRKKEMIALATARVSKTLIMARQEARE